VKEGYEVKVKWKRKGQTLDSMSFVDGDLQKIKEKILLETERVILQ
jgi:predicted DNA-binding antitoxin AbrB/MazE fold protein